MDNSGTFNYKFGFNVASTSKAYTDMHNEVSPRATLDDCGENIAVDDASGGVDGAKAVTAETFVEGMADVGVTDMVQYRLTQQAILADFGLEALRSRSLAELEQLATQMSADGMQSDMCKLLRHIPQENALLVCAGVGWKPGTIGHTTVGADMDSPAGYALKTGKPVLSNHLENEDRFRTPALLAEHGVKRAVNVLVMANNGPWGVLEVDSRTDGKFDVADIPFLQGFANLLGVAIERHQAEDRLHSAIEYQRLLVRESSHRAKNSLALVSSLLQLQARASSSSEVRSALNEAVARIMTIANAHDLLWQSDAAGELDLGDLVERLCVQLQQQMPALAIQTRTDRFVVDADRAIAAGLLVTELVTNASKHAYGGGVGNVMVSCTQVDGWFKISVADQGKGLPADFVIERAGTASLGMRMIRALAVQLGGHMEFKSTTGTEFFVSAETNTKNTKK